MYQPLITQENLFEKEIQLPKNTDGNICISTDPETQWNENIMNENRNTRFHKVIHDTRQGNSKVIGMSDDLIICVDEQKKKYNTWYMYDKDTDDDCKEMYKLMYKWPDAQPHKCQYGMKTLDLLLKDIFIRHRENPDKLELTYNYS